MTTAPILLILGAGPNIGAHVAKAFAAKGYKVATASRRTPPESDYLHVPVDLSKPESVPGVFETVKAKLGAAPSVVVYNGMLFLSLALHPVPWDFSSCSLALGHCLFGGDVPLGVILRMLWKGMRGSRTAWSGSTVVWGEGKPVYKLRDFSSPLTLVFSNSRLRQTGQSS